MTTPNTNPPRIVTTPSPNHPPPSSSSSASSSKWHHHLTVDTLLLIVSRTLLNPGLAILLILCLRAQATPPTHPSFILSVIYAVILIAWTMASALNTRIAHGALRAVDFESEVVVVTGGASGLGQLVVRMYAMRGAGVAVLDIKDFGDDDDEGDGGSAVIEEAFGQGVKYFRCDVGCREELMDVKGRIEKELGTPTILINCAAARINGQPLLSLHAEAVEKTIRTNLLAAFHAYQVFLPGMLAAENGGTIVTVSSVLGQLSAAGLSDYAASKAGLSALHRTVEAEMRATGKADQVKMLLVETGQMATPLFDWISTPSNFFAPILEPVQVAREIVSAVDNGRGGVIRLPAFAALVNWYAVLPAAVQRVARYLSGIDDAVAKARERSSEEAAAPSNKSTGKSGEKRSD